MAKRTPKSLTKSFVGDSFANFSAAVGIGAGNQSNGSGYTFSPISRIRLQMEYAYRSSWVVGRAVDCVAQDMTREGVTINSDLKPDALQKLDKEMARLGVWRQLCDTIKWSRLYGGALAFFMIDGQDPATPLRVETIGRGQFRGLLPMDRWIVNPSLSNLVEEYGPDFGQPVYYDTVPDTMGMPRMKIHHSRVIRLEGLPQPYWQRIAENLWGISILERLWDRLVAFDSTTQGVAQLVYKAHLRTYKVEGLREIISMGGDALKGLAAQINMIRRFQSNEGLTLMDAKDEFETHAYAFSGLDQVLLQFGQQLCGALEIPAVRLFGESPAGFNSGDSDLRNYYDTIKTAQATTLAPGVEKLYRLGYLSTFGKEPPEQFEIDFKPLWQLSDEQKAAVANTTTAAIVAAYSAQIISRATALKELESSSRETGIWTNITDDEIKEAEQEPAPSPEALGVGSEEEGGEAGKKPAGEGGGAKGQTIAKLHIVKAPETKANATAGVESRKA